MSRKRKQKRKQIQEFRTTTNVEHERMIVSVVYGATGVGAKGLTKNLEAVSGKHTIDSLGTSHVR
jgi:hypothetical protein